MRRALVAVAVEIGVLPACNPTPCLNFDLGFGSRCDEGTLAQRDDPLIVGFPLEQVDSQRMGHMRVGETIPLQIHGNGIVRVAWISSDPRVASVRSVTNVSGALVGLAPGSTTITADLVYSDDSRGNAVLWACQDNSTTSCTHVSVLQVSP